MNRYKSWLYLFLLINCFFIPGCRTLNSESDSKSNQTLKNTSKSLSYSDVLKKLNINLDDRMSREEFKERRVVIFYIDGLIKKVMEDMAFYGDAIEHKYTDGRRFYYTEELLEEYGISSEVILKDYWQHFKLKEGTPSTQYPERFDRYVRMEFLKLNNIRKYFIENAISYDNAYTVFPSLTVPANGSMFTGVDIDRHGIKSQAQVDRFALKEFAAGKLTDIKSISNVRFNLDSPPKNHDAILDMGIPTIYEILRDALQGNKQGQPYHFQWPILAPSLPINPSPVTKNFVLGSANKGSIDAYADVDNINFKGINLDLVKDNKVLVLWLPQVDHLSHGEDQDRMKELGLSDFLGAGQYGPSLRMVLKKADMIIGQIMRQYEITMVSYEGSNDRHPIADDTTFMLLADHGHLGGREFGKKPQNVSPLINKRWEVGPFLNELLTTNVLVPVWDLYKTEDNYFFKNAGAPETSIVAVDQEAYGVAKVYLPYKSVDSNDWTHRNTYNDLRNYLPSSFKDVTNTKPLDLISVLLNGVRQDTERNVIDDGSEPVDLIIMPRWDITRAPEICNAEPAQVLTIFRLFRETSSEGMTRVLESDITYCTDSEIAYYDKMVAASRDVRSDYSPVETSEDVLNWRSSGKFPEGWFAKGHTLDEWFKYSIDTQYPDAIRAFIRNSFNREISHNPLEREKRYGADLILTAREGWDFRTEKILSTGHGYPLKGSMQIPLAFYNPKKTTGHAMKISRPVRVTDIIPTLIPLLGLKASGFADEWFDGKVLTEISNRVNDFSN